MRLIEIAETRTAMQIIEAAKELRQKFRPAPPPIIFKPKPAPRRCYAPPTVENIDASSIYLACMNLLCGHLRVDVKLIQIVTALHYDLSRQDLMQQRGNAKHVWARHVAIYIAKTLTGKSLTELGVRFGGRDHTTILHAVRRIADCMANDPDVMLDVHSLMDKITKGIL